MEKIFAKDIFDKRLLLKMYKERLKFYTKKTNNPIKKGVKDHNKHLTIEDIKIANTHMKIYASANSLQLCQALCAPTDDSLPGFSIHGILQARIQEWVAMPSSRGSSQPRGMKICSTSKGTREMQIKLTMRYHYILIRMIKIQMTRQTSENF